MIRSKICRFLMEAQGEWSNNYERQYKDLNFKSNEMTVRNRLSNLLIHVKLNSPYYAGVTEGLKKDGLHERNVLQHIPILTKSLVRSNYDSIVVHGRPGQYENYSGGSTGEPLKIIQDSEYKLQSRASESDYYERFLSIDNLCSKKIILWGSERDVMRNSVGIRMKGFNRLTNTTFLNAFRLDNSRLADFSIIINRKKPEMIRAYAGSLAILARYINEHNIKMHRPNCLVVSAETLTADMRTQIEKAFNHPVTDFYGSREVGGIAGQCENGNMHVLQTANLVEIVDGQGKMVHTGEEGRILVTNLHNYSTPLIRYEIGDMAIRGDEKCKCGRLFPTIRKITGRITDNFIKRNGEMIHGEYFTHLFYGREWVVAFQVVQEAFEEITIHYVASTKPPNVEVEDIEKKIRIAMGDECLIGWSQANSIEPSVNGKYLYTICRIGRQ